MALASRFIPHAVKLPSASWINQIASYGPDLGVALIEESSGSATDREFVAARSVEPVLPIATSDLSILTTVGMAGLAISYPGLTAYGRELLEGSLPTAIGTADHLVMSVTDGLLVPVALSASHNQPASLSLMLHAVLGNNTGSGASPMIITSGQAIPSGAGATVNIYTTGVIKYTVSGGSSRLVQGISQQSVTFGIKVLKESDSGNVYLSIAAIIAHPKISFATKDAALAAEIGEGISVSAFACYFRKVASSGQRVPEATTSHVSVVGTAGMVTPGAVGFAHKQGAGAAFTYTPTLNSSLLTLSASAAIPTS